MAFRKNEDKNEEKQEAPKMQIPEPPTISGSEFGNELEAMTVTDREVANYEVDERISNAEDEESEGSGEDSEDDKPLRLSMAGVVLDESVVDESDLTDVTFVGMKNQFAKVPSRIQIIVPFDGTKADDKVTPIEHGTQYDFEPGQTRKVTSEAKEWLSEHPTYEFK
jgi:hypothetical protein